MHARSDVWLLTGPPGIGKSTVVSRVILNLRSSGLIVGGFVTSERRERGTRTGFTIRNLLSGEEAELASLTRRLGPKVGRYRVNLQALVSIAAAALRDAKSSELVVVDEVGPMELTSPDFRRALDALAQAGSPIFAVVHENMDDPLIGLLKEAAGGEVLEVTLHNRDHLAEEIAQRIRLVVKVTTEGETS